MVSPDRSSPRAAAGLRAAYRTLRGVTTRWMDNDVFGHVNNVTYYSYFDTAVTGWLMDGGLLGLHEGPMWMMAETGCRFLSEVAFPDALSVGMRLGRLGNSSVRYELAVFREGREAAAAEGHLVHVHVDRATRRPVRIPETVRAILNTLAL